MRHRAMLLELALRPLSWCNCMLHAESGLYQRSLRNRVLYCYALVFLSTGGFLIIFDWEVHSFGIRNIATAQPSGHGEAPEQRYKLDDLWLNRDTPDTERAIRTIDGAEASRNDTDVGFELARRTDG